MNPEEARAELARRELSRRSMATEAGASPAIAEDSGKFGGISKTPTMMEKIGSNLTSPRTRPFGMTGGAGVILSAAGIPEEDVLPMVGQGVGGGASGFTGAGFLGATGGAMVGQAGRQMFKSLRGQKPDLAEVGKEGLTTGAVEGLTRGAGNLVFRRQMTNELLGKLSSKLADMKNTLSSNPELKSPIHDIYSHMSEAYNSLPEPMQTGSVAKKLRNWMKYMATKAELSAKDLISMEADLGKAASYGEVKKGAFMPATEIPNVETNRIAKSSRNKVSELVDKVASDAGQKEFGQTSKKISKILSNPESHDVTRATGGFGSRLVAAGAVGGATQNFLAIPPTYLGMQALQSPEVRNLAFKALRSAPGKAIGAASKLSMSEILRRLSSK